MQPPPGRLVIFNSHAGGPARYVDGTRRLPISPLIDTYLVPEAPRGTRSRPIPPLATKGGPAGARAGLGSRRRELRAHHRSGDGHDGRDGDDCRRREGHAGKHERLLQGHQQRDRGVAERKLQRRPFKVFQACEMAEGEPRHHRDGGQRTDEADTEASVSDGQRRAEGAREETLVEDFLQGEEGGGREHHPETNPRRGALRCAAGPRERNRARSEQSKQDGATLGGGEHLPE
mmetsp:Transcript_69786/g.209602  ORF Transcript_69786/g.209602 Transcript_69786/m.209602 type:complete len:232 (+) Transcript_69786:30-725(+)